MFDAARWASIHLLERSTLRISWKVVVAKMTEKEGAWFPLFLAVN